MTEFKLCEEMGLSVLGQASVKVDNQDWKYHDVILASDVEKMLQGGVRHMKGKPPYDLDFIALYGKPKPVTKEEIVRTFRLLGKQETHSLADRIEKAGIE